MPTVRAVGVSTAVPVIRSPFAVTHARGMYAEAAAAGVRAVVASIPAWARTLVDRQTIPATVVDAGTVPSKPTFRNCVKLFGV